MQISVFINNEKLGLHLSGVPRLSDRGGPVKARPPWREVRAASDGLRHCLSNSAIMEHRPKDEKREVRTKALVDDEEEYPGILPCQGREGGLYPGVSRQSCKHL